MVLMACNGKQEKPKEVTVMDDKNAGSERDQILEVLRQDARVWGTSARVADVLQIPDRQGDLGKVDSRQQAIGSTTAPISNKNHAHKNFECVHGMEMDIGLSLTSVIADPVVVAPASSSNIGDLSINDDENIVEVTVEQVLRDDDPPSVPSQMEQVVLLSMVATKSTSEDLVSSTSESSPTVDVLEFIGAGNHLTPQINPISVSFTSQASLLRSQGQNLEQENEKLGVAYGSDQPLALSDNPILWVNGNIFEREPLEVPDDEDLSGGGDGKDDDSSGIILKDETDSAEGDVGSDQELTDTASETEGMQGSPRKPKPVIIISDQNYPRLVINFREEEVADIRIPGLDSYPENSHFLESNPRNAEENVVTVGNNNSIKESTYSPVQNWVESVQRLNKRKRTDSECLDEVP